MEINQQKTGSSSEEMKRETGNGLSRTTVLKQPHDYIDAGYRLARIMVITDKQDVLCGKIYSSLLVQLEDLHQLEKKKATGPRLLNLFIKIINETERKKESRL